jgi:hypothetical protein
MATGTKKKPAKKPEPRMAPVSKDLYGPVESAGLTIGPFSHGPGGLKVEGNPTFEEWEAAVHGAKCLAVFGLWFYGDLMVFGQERFGERYSQVLEASDYTDDALRLAEWVAKKFPPERRYPELSFSHHKEVAALPPKEADRLLAKAIEKGWSKRDIRSVINSKLAWEEPTESGENKGKTGVTRVTNQNGTAAVHIPDSRPEPEPEPVPTDAWGIPIQRHAEAAFEAVPKFEQMISLARQLQRLFNETANEPGGKFLTLPDVSSYRRGKKGEDGEHADRFVHEGLERFLHQVRNAVPTHTVCPWHFVDAPHPKDCSTCKNLNWTPPLSEKAIPKAAVAKAKATLGGGKDG